MLFKKAQAVYMAAILGILVLIAFWLILPTLFGVIDYGKTQINQPFVKMVMDFFPFAIAIMLLWFLVRMARTGE